jgi:hypothetical protein
LRIRYGARTTGGGICMTAQAAVQVHSRPKPFIDLLRLCERVPAGLE